MAVCVNLAVSAWFVSLVSAGTVLVALFLFGQARRQFREAHSMVAHSIADGTISSAAMGDRA